MGLGRPSPQERRRTTTRLSPARSRGARDDGQRGCGAEVHWWPWRNLVTRLGLRASYERSSSRTVNLNRQTPRGSGLPRGCRSLHALGEGPAPQKTQRRTAPTTPGRNEVRPDRHFALPPLGLLRVFAAPPSSGCGRPRSQKPGSGKRLLESGAFEDSALAARENAVLLAFRLGVHHLDWTSERPGACHRRDRGAQFAAC